MAEEKQWTDEEIVSTPADELTDGFVTIRRGGHNLHCLTVIGQIEGHYLLPSSHKATRYEHVIPRLVAVEASEEIDGLLLLLNTVGGDIEAGLALSELLAGMQKPTVSLVLGGGHSIAVPLAVAAKRSYIAPSATMTVHPVRMNGLVLGVPQTFDYFHRVQERIVDFVTSHCSVPAERFRQMMLHTEALIMDVGTVLDGESAVREGLIDKVGTLSDALDGLCHMIDENRK